MKIFVFWVALALLCDGTDGFLHPSSAWSPALGARWVVQTTSDTTTGTSLISDKRAQLSRVEFFIVRAKTSARDSSSSTALFAAPKIVIAGAPASGKGTQCEKIQEKLGVVHLSTGDMLRAAVAAGTDVGKEAKAYMDSGKLVPDSTIIGVVRLSIFSVLEFAVVSSLSE